MSYQCSWTNLKPLWFWSFSLLEWKACSMEITKCGCPPHIKERLLTESAGTEELNVALAVNPKTQQQWDKMMIWHQFTLNVQCQPWVLSDKQSPWSNNWAVRGLHAAWQINKGLWLMTTQVIQVLTFWWSIFSVILFSIMHNLACLHFIALCVY